MKILLCSDLHLRHDMPTCRCDEDWIESQRIDLQNIGKIAKKNNVEQVWVLGDIFHRPVEPPEVVNLAISEMKSWPSTYIMAGNHDLQFHAVSNASKSSYGTLREFFDSISLATVDMNAIAFDFGTEMENNCGIVCTHQLVFPNEEARGLASGKTAEEIVKEFPRASAILMGDYHEGWDKFCDDGVLIMCGCMNIQSGKLKDYSPRVVIFDTETYEYHSEYLPQEHVKITTEHLVEAKQRDERLEKCMESVSGLTSEEFDFIGNLKAMEHKVPLVTELLNELNNKV